MFPLRLGVSICLDRVSIESLDLDSQENLDIFKISTILMRLDNLDKNLNATKSQLKNLNREKKNSGLNMMDNLDTLKDNLNLDLNWSRLSRPQA